jgi:hypothetical protein
MHMPNVVKLGISARIKSPSGRLTANGSSKPLRCPVTRHVMAAASNPLAIHTPVQNKSDVFVEENLAREINPLRAYKNAPKYSDSMTKAIL